jgi:hypothetical protein
MKLVSPFKPLSETSWEVMGRNVFSFMHGNKGFLFEKVKNEHGECMLRFIHDELDVYENYKEIDFYDSGAFKGLIHYFCVSGGPDIFWDL